MPNFPLDMSAAQRKLGVRINVWAAVSPFAKYVRPRVMLHLQRSCDDADYFGYTPLSRLLDEKCARGGVDLAGRGALTHRPHSLTSLPARSSWARLMCCTEEEGFFAIAALLPYTVTGDAYGACAALARLCGAAPPTPRAPVKVHMPRPMPLTPTVAKVLDMDAASTPSPSVAQPLRSCPPAPAPVPLLRGNKTAEPDMESGESFFIRTEIHKLQKMSKGILTEDEAKALLRRSMSLGRKVFLRALKELAVEAPCREMIGSSFSKILTHYEVV